jgi:hypothetical protein
MMHEETMNPAIPVIKRMEKYKPEGSGSSGRATCLTLHQNGADMPAKRVQ